MNIKLHTPKSLQSGSGLSSVKQFFLALLATTISIVLTFGTAAVIDNHKKKAAKKEMVMMVIDDFDKTISLIEKMDSGLRECRRLQHDIAIHPEYYDSLHNHFAPAMTWSIDEFPETTEKIFSTSIETFSTIGDVNFVNEVSNFYITRHKYKELILDELKNEDIIKNIMSSLKSLLNVDFPGYALSSRAYMEDMKACRGRCMQMMNISKEDMIEFSNQHTIKNANFDNDILKSKVMKEYYNYIDVLEQAKKKIKD